MTMTIFRPDANVESTTVDGDVSDINDAVWDTIHDAAGSAFADQGQAEVSLFATATPDVWSELYRAVIMFDISGLPADTLIQDFLLQIKCLTLVETVADQSVVLVEVATNDDVSLEAGDYAIANFTVGTPLTSAVSLASMSTLNNIVFPLTQAGKDYIQAAADGSGIVRFGLLLESDRADLEPTWGSTDQAQFVFATADTAQGDAPELILTYAIPAGGTLGGQSGGMALLNL